MGLCYRDSPVCTSLRGVPTTLEPPRDHAHVVMKVGRQYLGRMVEVTWRDPGHDRYKCRQEDASDLPKGMAALATWKERGILDDMTDGILRIRHSDACEPRSDRPDEFLVTWVPEALVESILAYVVESPVSP